MISKSNRSESLDYSKINDRTQRASLREEFHLLSYQTSLRLRHLTQINGSNLEVSKDITPPPIPNILPALKPRIKPNTGFYFTLEHSSKLLPLFTSECHHSNCPTWDSFNCIAVIPANLLSLKGIVIRVCYKTDDDKSHHISTWGVNFSGLIPLPTSTLHLQQYPSNTLIMKIRGHYYTSFDCVKNLKLFGDDASTFSIQNGISVPLSETKPSYSVSSVCRLHSTKRAIRQQEQKIERLKEQLEHKDVRKNSQRTLLNNKVEDMCVKVSLLKEQLITEVHSLKSIQTATNKLDLDNQDKGIELLESFQVLNRQLAVLRRKEEKLIEDSSLLKDILDKVKERRIQLLLQIPLVFPIEQMTNESKSYTICDVFLPDAENYNGYSDQTLSISLGFVAQLLVKISHIVNIPLKYPITLRGSLSSIADLTSTQLQDVETQFPLYTRGKEREKLHFNYAVFLLNKNIAQLRWSCGLPTPDLRTTLVNICTLLEGFYNTSGNQSRVYMPDTVVLQPILPASVRQNSFTQSALESSYNKYSLPSQHYSDSDVAEHSLFNDVKLSQTLCDCSSSDSDNGINALISKDIINSLESLVSHSKSICCSLDKGLNCLIESISGDSLEHCEPLSSKITNKHITKASGSFPDLTTNSSTENVEKKDAAIGFNGLHDQTTLLLRSWHDDNPTPYASNITTFNSVEELQDAESTLCSTKVKIKCANAHDSPLRSSSKSHLLNDNGSVNQVSDRMLEDEHSKSNSYDNLKSTIFKEIGVSLSDYGISEESFLTDVASRTANLASQNCSFKMSHLHQSTQGE